MIAAAKKAEKDHEKDHDIWKKDAGGSNLWIHNGILVYMIKP